MLKTETMREAILDTAERKIRTVGFNAVSFRDLASEVGVKSSSVHYHFPQKADLGVALIRRYRNRFEERLARIDAARTGPVPALQAFMDIFADMLTDDGQICLCGILGAEARGLPQEMRDELTAFFRMTREWLTPIHRRMRPTATLMSPLEVVSALEGALILCTVMGNRDALNATVARIASSYRSAMM